MAKLTLSFKDKKLKIFPISGPELVVGRDPACSVHIDSLAVQPLHARIYTDGEYFCIENLQTDDPVQINHKPLAEPATLQDGDQIQVGKHTLSFSSEPANEGVVVNHAPQRRVLTGWLQIMSGSHLGRTIRLDRAMTRLGKSGQESAIIVRREDGYFIPISKASIRPRSTARPSPKTARPCATATGSASAGWNYTSIRKAVPPPHRRNRTCRKNNAASPAFPSTPPPY